MKTVFMFCCLCATTFAGPPITVRDSAGRIVSTIRPTNNGSQVVRDNRGRITATVTVKSGTAVVRDNRGSLNRGSLLPSKSGISGKTGRK